MNNEETDQTRLSKIDCGIKSIASLHLPSCLLSLNLHSNTITAIERLSHLQRLNHLDLSSNQITKITGLQALTSLKTLNLACNRLVTVENLNGLRHLTNLNLSYNKIQFIHGLADLWGADYSLENLTLNSNYLSSLDECTYYLSGLVKLKHLTLDDNKFVDKKDYRPILFRMIKSLISIDGRDLRNKSVNILPNFISSSSESTSLEISEPEIKYSIKRPQLSSTQIQSDSPQEPKLDLIEDKIHKLLLIREKLKSISKNDNESTPNRPKSPKLGTDTIRENLNRVEKPLVGILKSPENDKNQTKSENSSQSSLNEIISVLRDQIKFYQETQETNLKIINELKSNLENCHAEQQKKLTMKDELMSKKEEDTKKLNEEIEELKKKLDSLEKNNNLPTVKAKLEEKFKNSLNRQLGNQKEAFELVIKEQKDRIESLEMSYKSLEDEFRAALTYEAQRYTDISKRFETVSAECDQLRVRLGQSETSNERNEALINELNVLIKEQKSRLAGLLQLRKEKQDDVHKRNARLKEAVNELDALKEQFEACKKEKSNLENKLKTVLAEMDVLKRERHTWQHKLNEQKNFLLNENTRIEIEAKQLRSERDQLVNNLAKETDSCKIKSKIIEDQTETIRKMKNALLERDEIVRKTREEAIEAQKSLEKQLSNEMDLTNELKFKLEGCAEMKREYDELRAKWREKSQLIGELDNRVRKMKEEYEKREKELTLTNQNLTSENEELKTQLRKIDDNFRQQYDVEKKEHLKQIDKLKREHEEKLAQYESKIKELEEEMRQILIESDNKKSFYETKIKSFSSLFAQIQEGLI